MEGVRGFNPRKCLMADVDDEEEETLRLTKGGDKSRKDLWIHVTKSQAGDWDDDGVRRANEGAEMEKKGSQERPCHDSPDFEMTDFCNKVS